MNKIQIRIILRTGIKPYNITRPWSWSVNRITAIEAYIKRYNRTFTTQLDLLYQ